MSRTAAVALGLLLAVGGFALGQQLAGSGESPAGATFESTDEVRTALAGAMRGSDALERAAGLASLLQHLGPEGVPAVRTLLRVPELDLGAAEIELLVAYWARHEPEAATRWAYAAPTIHTAAALLPAVEAWARVDPRAAVESVKTTQGVGGTRTDLAEIALIRGWFASGRPGLEDYIRGLGMGFARQRALGTFAREWIRRDGPEPVQRWAEALPDEDQRYKQAAFRRIGSELAEADLEAARAFCEKHCEGPFGDSVRERIAVRWAPQDGLATMEWLGRAPATMQRVRALRAAYVAWMRTDGDAAMAWIADRGIEGVEPWMWPAVEGYASRLSLEDPEQALRWAELILDPSRRELAQISFARRWRLMDEAAAEAWLAQADLSEEALSKVRAPRREMPQRPRRRGARPPGDEGS